MAGEVIWYDGLPNQVNCREDEGQVPLVVCPELLCRTDLSGQHLKSWNGFQILICYPEPGLCNDIACFCLQKVDHSKELCNALF